ncbi:MAG: hypothetical protein HY291_06770 [Planctomycetes bacterium]|nr:hypothetical protein [Planctomycetota bacterium]
MKTPVLLLVLLAAACAATESDGLVPVKKEQLDGEKLLLTAAHCTLELPSADWKWKGFEGGSPRNFICQNPKTRSEYLIQIGKFTAEFTDHQPKSLLENAKKAAAGKGLKIENDKFEFVEGTGAKKAVRITFEEVAGGKRTLVVIYILATQDQENVKLEFREAAAAEPEAFKKLMSSLKIAGSAAPAGEKKETGK